MWYSINGVGATNGLINSKILILILRGSISAMRLSTRRQVAVRGASSIG